MGYPIKNNLLNTLKGGAHMKFGKRFIEFLILLAALCLMAPVVQAADVSIGGGIGFAPDYEGSSDYEIVPVPFASVKWSNGMYFRLEGLTARANLLPSSWVAGLQLGPMYNYRAKRSDVENNQVDAMNSVSDANELGAFVAFDFNNWYLGLDALADMGQAHDWWYATLSGGYNWVISNAWSLKIGAFTTYANEDYMETYFGVDANNVGASGFAFYDPDGGVKDVGLDLGLGYMINSNWSTRAVGKYTMLVGDADDASPVVDEGDESQFFGALLVVYTF
jgi:outer membrane scaffolding protein for murein synthesis (MipA/OmpV family)